MTDLPFYGPETEIGKAYAWFHERFRTDEDRKQSAFQGVYGGVAIYERKNDGAVDAN